MPKSSGSQRSNAEWVSGLQRVPADAVLLAELRSFCEARASVILSGYAAENVETLKQIIVDNAIQRVMRGLSAYRGEAAFLNWVRPSVYRAFLDAHKKEQQLPTAPLDSSEGDDDYNPGALIDPQPSSEDKVIQAEERAEPAFQQRTAVIEDCLGTLSDAEREALEAYASYLYRLDTVQYRERILQQLREQRERAQGKASAPVPPKQKYDDPLRSQRIKEIAARFGLSERMIRRYTDEKFKNNALVKMRRCLADKGYDYASSP
jgi:RNA polymerase sigma factor (sigma-70 family)